MELQPHTQISTEADVDIDTRYVVIFEADVEHKRRRHTAAARATYVHTRSRQHSRTLIC